MKRLSLSLRTVIFIILLTLLLLHTLWLATHLHTLPVLRQVHLQNISIALEAQNLNGGKDVLSINGFSFLILALLACFTCYERNELRDTLLYRLFGILGNFGIVRQCFLHDSPDIGNGEEARVVGSVPRCCYNYLSPCLSPSYISNNV